MAQRLLDRLTLGNSSGIPFVRLWAKTCDKIEELFEDLFFALSSMPDLPDVTITANYMGQVDPADQLPFTVQAHRYTSETDNTADATWAFNVDSGALTATIAAGALEVTDITSTSVITITSSFGGVDKSRTFTANFPTAAPPQTGSAGGTSASDTSFNTFNSASMAEVSDELTVTVGSAGQVQLSAPLRIYTSASGGAGTYPVYGIWQWWDGGAWADLGTEVVSSPNCAVSGRSLAPGTLNAAYLKTGLTPAASEKFRLMARNGTGTRTMSLSGTASAVAS